MSESEFRHPHLLSRQNTCLLIVDVQERFRAHIDGFAEMVKNIVRMMIILLILLSWIMNIIVCAK